MKTIIITISLLVLFTLASCTTQIRTPPLTEKVPDTLTKPTKSVVVEDVIAEIPVDTLMKTEKKTEVKIDVPIEVLVQNTTEPMTIVLPKDSVVILPENTPIRTMEATPTSIPATTSVVLPAGTMISLSRINWYAVLFYVGMVVAVGSYYWSRYITKTKVMSTPQPLNEDVDVSSR